MSTVSRAPCRRAGRCRWSTPSATTTGVRRPSSRACRGGRRPAAPRRSCGWVRTLPRRRPWTAGTGGCTGWTSSSPQRAEQLLGSDVAARFDGRLPFLLKVLAISRPLSLQVHPAEERARTGFEDEAACSASTATSTRTPSRSSSTRWSRSTPSAGSARPPRRAAARPARRAARGRRRRTPALDAAASGEGVRQRRRRRDGVPRGGVRGAGDMAGRRPSRLRGGHGPRGAAAAAEEPSPSPAGR